MAKAARLRLHMKGPDMSARTVLITGGTSGLGLETVRALHGAGATVIVGTRDPAHHESLAEELGNERLHGFVSDIADPEALERRVEAMRESGLRPTDVVHAAAGGLEPVLRTLARVMTGLKKLEGAELEKAHRAAIAELAPLVAESRDLALAVNLSGPAWLLDRLVPDLPAGGTVTFYSSLWTSFYPHPQVPIYYQNVADSKRQMELWLEARARGWSERGITTAILSSTWIANTRIGQVLDRFCAEVLPDAEREQWRATYVTCAEMVAATLDVMRDAPGGLVRRFLPGPGRVVGNMGPDDHPMTFAAALAQHSPAWS
jgi:NAD(P)-dependent dehydrogenase (short-subunit alcohol dehydrogenase family)